MFSMFRSVIFGFAVVSLLGSTTASAQSIVSDVMKHQVVKKIKSVTHKGVNHPATKTITNLPSDDSNTTSGSDTTKKVAVYATKAAITYATEAAAVPVAVAGASALGVTASTGTAIATLSGAAATNATLYAIGAPIATALGTTIAAPAVIGGVIVGGAALLVSWGINAMIDDD